MDLREEVFILPPLDNAASVQDAGYLPLQGVRVLDFSKVPAGPLCTQHLGDIGAGIIKVEPCRGGDDTRTWPPFRDGEGTIFFSVNRNKRSLARRRGHSMLAGPHTLGEPAECGYSAAERETLVAENVAFAGEAVAELEPGSPQLRQPGL